MEITIFEQELKFEEAQRYCENRGLTLIMCSHENGKTTIYAVRNNGGVKK